MLHLAATDADDLPVISAQMQDAVIRFGDIRYLKRQRRLALVANRFAWDGLPEKTRRRCGLVINAVLSAKRTGPKALNPDTILSLLAITFTPNGDSAALSGTIFLTFAGGHSFALEVECVDMMLDDLGATWGTERVPSHGETA